MNSIHPPRETSLTTDLINLARICERQQWLIDYLLDGRDDLTLKYEDIDQFGMIWAIRQLKERVVQRAYKEHGGNILRVSQRLKMSRANVYNLLGESERSERGCVAASASVPTVIITG